MPVRTARGRAAVYRKVWGWPLRSPRHLVATVAALAVLGTGVAAAAAAVRPEPARPAAGPGSSSAPTWSTPTTTTSPTSSASTVEPSSTPADPGPSADSTTAPAAPVQPSHVPDATEQALVVAREFMARWVNHPAGMTSQQWAAQLAQYVIPEYRVVLESVDPANIPATRVTGAPVPTTATASVVEADVPTDGGVVHLVVLLQPDRTWLVRSYDLAS